MNNEQNTIHAYLHMLSKIRMHVAHVDMLTFYGGRKIHLNCKLDFGWILKSKIFLALTKDCLICHY